MEWTRFLPLGLGVGAVAVAMQACGGDDHAPVAPELKDTGTSEAAVDSGKDAAGDSADSGVPLLKPIQLASKLNHPLGLGLDTKAVYWVNQKDGTLLKLARDAPTGTVPTTLASGIEAPERVAVDATHVYFTSLNSAVSRVMRVKTDGGPTETVAAGEKHPRDIVVDDANLFWTDNNAGFVRRWKKAGALESGIENVVAMDVTLDGQPWGVAVLGSMLYFSTFDVRGKIFEIPKATTAEPGDAGTDSGPPPSLRKLALEQDTALVLTADAANVYWTVKNQGVVLQIPRTGPGTPLVLANKQGTPLGITVDTEYVYWCTYSTDGAVVRMKIGGEAAPTVLANKQQQAAYVVTDGTWLYWTEEGPGTTFFGGSINAMRLR